MRRAGPLAALLIAGIAALAHAAPPPAVSELRVFAAASLTDAFADIAHAFERLHPDVRVRLVLAGSQQLAAQIEQGAPADVFAPADARWLGEVYRHALLADSGVVFARNRLVVIVPRTNPARIERLQSLAWRGVKLVIAAAAVPAGHYSREMLEKLGREAGFPAGYAAAVLANVVSEEDNVRAVASKVQLGEADAGIVYRSDLSPALARHVRMFELPEHANILAHYPIARLRASRNPAAAAFIAFVCSGEGQAALLRHGLLPAIAQP